MIASFVTENTRRIWSDETETALAPRDGIAEFVGVLPLTLHLTARKLWAIHALLAEVKEPDDLGDTNSLDACEMLAADAGHDIEVLIGDFERWLRNPKVLLVRVEEALAQAGIDQDGLDDTDRAAAGDQRNRIYTSEIAKMLRTAPFAYVLGLRSSIEDSLSKLRAEELHDKDGAEPLDDDAESESDGTDDDNGCEGEVAKQADIDAIALRLRGARAGFVSAIRSNLADPNSRWSQFLAEDDTDSDDGSDDTIDAIIFIGPEDGQPEETLTAELSTDQYQALRREVRGVVERFREEHAASPTAPPESDKVAVTV